MKTVNCNCGRKIKIGDNIVGLNITELMNPTEVYVCTCGTVYIPVHLSCMSPRVDDDDPIVMTPKDFLNHKERTRQAYIKAEEF